MNAYFVTATGTDIGKTFVTAGLIRSLRAQNRKVSALKPVVSGFAPGAASQSDPGVLLSALGQGTLEEIAPFRFAAPLSPDMAATREGRRIDFDALVGFCRDAIARDDGTLFIEGVGGIMVPLDASHTVRDWACALGLPLILVAGSYLGTISHTLTALSVIAGAGLKVRLLIINDSGDGMVPISETVATLGRFAPQIGIATLPRGATSSDFARLAERF